ncbi:argininosuccinate lyase [Trinickia dinghuensis]|uniref:Argininosuccinate lyase n=1 Tax=Trinickia dinghuensis TaxID=2291023 RepID=A0A3D8K583_9BURK|nr:argininosuccinate lyase [Trinickia dinghuensis]RDV00380.1 argininosuccinate lyase [Trinickia dinghuensis]
MESKVSGFLHEALSGEAQKAIFLPWIAQSFEPSLPLLTEINRAHVVMLHDTGLLTSDTASRLLAVVDELADTGPPAFTLDGSFEDVYFNYEAQVIRRLGQDVGGRLHTARSRNDLQSTLDRMRARNLALSLIAGNLSLRRSLLDRASQYTDCVMPGYTHLQHAQPITFGFYLAGVEKGMQRDFDRLLGAFHRLNQCPLGAGAMAGTTFPIDRQFVSALLGFSAPVAHALDAVASKDPLLELLCAALFVATTFGRLAQDFYLMSTFEFSTLTLPDSLAITSSIMPQKKNQAVLEFLKGRQSHILGALVTGFASFRAAPYSHVLDSNADSLHWLWQAADELVDTIPVVDQVINRATPNRERMAELAGANFSTATDLADFLVREKGMSFKEAHHITGRVVRLAIDTGLGVADIPPELVARAALETTGRMLSLTSEEIADALDPRAAVERRRSGGGPSSHDMESLIEQSMLKLAADREEHKRIGSSIERAGHRLRTRAAELRRPVTASSSARPHFV